MGERPRLELYAGLASLYRSRDFSDLVLIGTDGTRHPVHRAIVCPRSEYINNIVKERRWRESLEEHQPPQIPLPDTDEVVRLLIEYLYLLDYDPIPGPYEDHSGTPSVTSPSLHTTSDDNLSVRTEAVHFGQVYGTSAVSAFGGPAAGATHSAFPPVMPLRSRSAWTAGHASLPSLSSAHALPTSASDFVDFGHPGPVRRRKSPRRSSNAPDPSPLATRQANLVLHAKMYAAANTYRIDGLKALSLDKFKIQLTRHWDSEEFAEAIHIVYSTTEPSDKDMREAVADTLGWYSYLLDKPEIEVAIMEINGLAYELLKRSRRAEPEYME